MTFRDHSFPWFLSFLFILLKLLIFLLGTKSTSCLLFHLRIRKAPFLYVYLLNLGLLQAREAGSFLFYRHALMNKFPQAKPVLGGGEVLGREGWLSVPSVSVQTLWQAWPWRYRGAPAGQWPSQSQRGKGMGSACPRRCHTLESTCEGRARTF